MTTTKAAACPVCGNIYVTQVFTKDDYAIVRCNSCGLLHVSPIPSDEAIAEHYQDPAYFSGNEQQGYLNYADTERALLPFFRRRLDTIDAHLPNRGRLLDFGCAAGFFLKLAQARGWQVSGVELSSAMAQHAAEMLKVPVATSLEALGARDFDAITLWEVVEHLPQPVPMLRDLHDHLHPGGMLMLSTPNNGHWQAVREPENWEVYRPPAHLLYFTAGTLENTLKRAGFENIIVKKASPLPPLPPLVRRLTQPLQRNLARGQAKAWSLALHTWRVIRVMGWGWQRVAHRSDDIFTSLEATAFRR